MRGAGWVEAVVLLAGAPDTPEIAQQIGYAFAAVQSDRVVVDPVEVGPGSVPSAGRPWSPLAIWVVTIPP